MKKLTTSLLFMLAILSINAQNLNEISFIFENKNIFTEQFKSKTEEKVFHFKIDGINNETQAEILKNKILSYRGVKSFKITKQNGNYFGDITLYKYAYTWQYYQTFMKLNKINYFVINGNKYTWRNLQ